LKLDELNKSNDAIQENLNLKISNTNNLLTQINELKQEKDSLTESLKLAHSNSGKIFLDQREISNELSKAETVIENLTEINKELENKIIELQQKYNSSDSNLSESQSELTRLKNDLNIVIVKNMQLEND
jgi:chromosome segregation ATPase